MSNEDNVSKKPKFNLMDASEAHWEAMNVMVDINNEVINKEFGIVKIGIESAVEEGKLETTVDRHIHYIVREELKKRGYSVIYSSHERKTYINWKG